MLVLNPLIAAMVEPYAGTSAWCRGGWIPSRFPWPVGEKARAGRPTVGSEGGVRRPAPSAGGRPSPIADGLERETGSDAVHGGGSGRVHQGVSCRPRGLPVASRRPRSDFELVVTFDPPGRIDEFTRSVGWCSQADCHAIIVRPTSAWCRQSPRKG